MPVECVAQISIQRNAARQRVVHVDAEVGEARVVEKAAESAKIRFDVQDLAAKIPGHVRRKSSARECRHHGARVARAADQRLANTKITRRHATRPVERQNFGFESVYDPATDIHRAGRKRAENSAPCARELERLSDR